MILTAVLLAVTGFGQSVAAIQDSIESGNLAQALLQVNTALTLHPKDGGLFNLRGVIHARKNELPAARVDFEKAVALAPALTPAWQNLARSCQLSADDRCASEAWRRVIQALPSDPEARFSLAAVEEAKAKYADSLLQLERLPRDESARSAALAIRCADLAGLNRLPEATEVARRLIKASEFSAADVQLILPVLTKPEMAPLVITLVEALSSPSLDLLRPLVSAYEHAGRLPDARKILEHLSAADPRNPEHLFELARVAYRMHDLEGALGYLGHVRDLTPSDPRVHFLFGMVLEELKLPLEARKSAEKAVELDPGNPDYNYGLGSIILASRDASGAVACFRHYVEARPRDPRGHFALGVAYFATGDYDNCGKEMQGISGDPETAAGAAYFLGRVARIDGDLDRAAALFDRAAHLLPDYAETYAELARVRLRQNRLEDAHAAINHALSLDPQCFQAQSALLALYERTHDARSAEQRAKLQKLDEDRGKRQELMLRKIEVRPY